MRKQSGIIMGLWMSATAATLGAALAPEIGAELGGQVGQLVEDASRRGDVLALMAICTTASIGFSAWLVKQLLSRVTDTVRVLDRLVVSLQRRPCLHQEPLEPDQRP